MITSLGPFKSIDVCYYDEVKDTLSVISHDNNVKMFKLSLKLIGHKKPAHQIFRPIIMHTFDNKELMPNISDDEVDGFKNELS